MAITTRKLATLDPANFDPGPAADTMDAHPQQWEALQAVPPGPRWWPPVAYALAAAALAGVVTLAYTPAYTVGLALLAMAVAGLSVTWIAAGYRGRHRHPGPR